MTAGQGKTLDQLLGDIEDHRLDFGLMVKAFNRVAWGDDQNGEAPPWLWTVSRHWDRLEAALVAYLDARPGSRLSVVEGGQGVICPFIEPGQTPELPADG